MTTLRAELNAELGFYPASVDEASIVRHRAAAERDGLLVRYVEKRWAHHRIARQRAADEARMRAEFGADLP